MPNEKRCPKCGEVKDSSEFYRNKSSKSGLSCWCKACSRASTKRYYEAHKEEIRAKDRARYQANAPELRARSKRWREANPDYAKEWHKAHPEAVKVIRDRYRAKNRDKIRATQKCYYEAHKKKGDGDESDS